MIESTTIYITAFNDYKALGLDPLPIPYKDGYPTKGPEVSGWQIRAANDGYTDADFVGPCNIGVLLGGPKHITDIDCDSPEAIAVAGEILSHLPTTWTFGRESKPRSHFIYSCDQSLSSEKISDPTDRQCVVEYRCVNADGHRGSQTVFPPSINFNPKNGKSEHVDFESGSTTELAKIPASDLRKVFVLIGVVALLAKHFPADSERHNTILALSGVFARAGMSVTKATPIISLSYQHSKGYQR
jgi:hypothetical protein